MRENPANITIKNENVSEILEHEIPYKLGKYEIKGELGRGTCGIVYKGFDPFVRRDVAIKVGWTEPSPANQGTSSTQQDVFNEAYAAGKLQHPNITALYDAQTENELNYLIMEFVDGETLLEYCRPNGKRLSPRKALRCMFESCMALDFSHQAGVIHRDIKPSNIMLSKDGETKIMDFSVAEVTQKNQTSISEMIVGSPNYMSPEQVQRKTVGPQSDLYSLAAVMFQLLTGRTLYPKSSVKKIFNDIVNTPPPKLKEFRPDLPEALSGIISKALSKNPENRFKNGKDMAAEITAVYDNFADAEHSVKPDEKRPVLMKLPFFTYFDSVHLEELMTASSILKFSKGEVITKAGDIDNSFYLVAHGKVNVTQDDGTVLSRLIQGECFGELGSMSQYTHNTGVVAETDAFLLKVNAVRIDNLSHSTQLLFYKSFTRNLIKRLATPAEK